MKHFILALIMFTMALQACHKEKESQLAAGCDIQKVYADNASKTTIVNGIWGTVAYMEGNCMPVVYPTSSTCKTCPVKRTMRIYEYTTVSQASPQQGPGFFDSFSTALVKELETDDNGFFQTELAPGTYTVVVLENGKLYTFGFDSRGGISPVKFEGGKQNVNLTLIYKAVF